STQARSTIDSFFGLQPYWLAGPLRSTRKRSGYTFLATYRRCISGVLPLVLINVASGFPCCLANPVSQWRKPGFEPDPGNRRHLRPTVYCLAPASCAVRPHPTQPQQYPEVYAVGRVRDIDISPEQRFYAYL